MENKWVDRDGLNKIVTVYANRQEHHTNLDKMTDQDQEVMDFINPPYAPDLLSAKIKKKMEMRKSAAGVLREYRDSDINITPAAITDYKAVLKNDFITVISPALDALITVESVKDYEETWSTP